MHLICKTERNNYNSYQINIRNNGFVDLQHRVFKLNHVKRLQLKLYSNA